jgi:hypothetical protein
MRFHNTQLSLRDATTTTTKAQGKVQTSKIQASVGDMMFHSQA